MNRPQDEDPQDAFYHEVDMKIFEERVMNTLVGKFAPADFLYDPLKDHEEKFS